jgi:hypothetical protein
MEIFPEVIQTYNYFSVKKNINAGSWRGDGEINNKEIGENSGL